MWFELYDVWKSWYMRKLGLIRWWHVYVSQSEGLMDLVHVNMDYFLVHICMWVKWRNTWSSTHWCALVRFGTKDDKVYSSWFTVCSVHMVMLTRLSKILIPWIVSKYSRTNKKRWAIDF